jgi:ribosomal protein RSM22 (predicted rRNA methylase)
LTRSLSAIAGSGSAIAAAAERAPAAATAAAANTNNHNPNPAALVRLPTDLAGAVERFLGGGASSASSSSKRRSMSLGEALRRLARSSGGKGAAADNAATPTAPPTLVRRTRSGRPRARDVAALEDVVAERGAAGLSERDLELYMFGAQAGRARDRRRRRGGVEAASAAAGDPDASPSPLTPAYDRADAEAYALARLAPSYAACRAAMAEVAARLGSEGGGGHDSSSPPPPSSSFAPRRMLDYGAGPGTAIWAAQDVWLTEGDDQQPAALTRAAHAVEPSAAMTALGRRLEAARAQGSIAELEARRQRTSALPEGFPRRPLAAPVSWAPSLAALRRRAAGGAGRRRYDLVTCSYVLSELGGGGGEAAAAAAEGAAAADDGHADRVVRALWDMVAEGGVLLLVEPGTRAGSAAVLRARALVLDVALRRAAKRDKRLRAAGAAATEGGDDDEEPEGGAYVVAPCPHDGPCPMQRAAEMAMEQTQGDDEEEEEDDSDDDERDAATAPNSSNGSNSRWSGAWCHFGQRLQRPPFMQRSASRGAARRTDHQVERFSYVAIRRGRRPEPLPPGHLLLGGAEGGSAVAPPFAARRGEEEEAVEGASSSHEDEEGDGRYTDAKEVVLDDQLLDAIDDMVPPSSLDPAAEAVPTSGDEEDDDDENGDDEEGPALPVSAAAGPGLVDRLVALDAAGVEWWRPEALAELQYQQQPQDEEEEEERPAVVASASQAPPPAAAAAAEDEDEDDDAFRQRRDAQAALIAASRSGATGWARLVRPPLKRGGHVVVDLCCAASGAPPSPSSAPLRRPSPAPEGRLVRATVTRSSLIRAWGGGGGHGPAAYALARAARWGDAMPLPPRESGE